MARLRRGVDVTTIRDLWRTAPRIARLFLACLCSCSLGSANAVLAQTGTLHAVIIADTADKSIGNDVKIDMNTMGLWFRGQIPIDRLKVIQVSGDDVNEANLRETVNGLTIGSNDTIVLYFSGHGGYFQNTQEQYVYFSTTQERIVRSQLMAMIEARSPARAVLITDTCSNYSNKPPPRSSLAYASARVDAVSPLFQSLFFGPTRRVDISGTKPGEVGGVDGTRNRGSFFTYGLTKAGEKLRNSPSTWRQFLAQVQIHTTAIFQENFPQGWDFKNDREELGVTDGAPDQFNQTVHVYNLRDGASPPPPNPPGGGPVFGVRTVPQGGVGMQITEVIANTPAAVAGLEPGDIILTINGRSVRSQAEFSDAVDNSPRTMNITVRNVRGGPDLQAQVVLNRPGPGPGPGPDPDPDPGPGPMPPGMRIVLGVNVVENGGQGVRVTTVIPDTPAVAIGLEPGDVILRINNQPLGSVRQFTDAIRNVTNRLVVDVRNVRGGPDLRFDIPINPEM